MAAQETKRKTTPHRTISDRERSVVIPEMPRTMKFLWGLILAGLVTLLAFSAYFFYYSAQAHCEGAWESQNVRVALNSSDYLSVDDVEDMRVTAVNERGGAATITVTVSYSGTLLCLTEDNESHVVVFKSLSAHERATGRLRVQFPLCLNQLSFQNWPDREIQFEVWLAVDDQQPRLLDTVSLHVMPVPKARALGNVSGALLAGLAMWSWKELWEWIKKAERPAAERKAKAKT